MKIKHYSSEQELVAAAKEAVEAVCSSKSGAITIGLSGGRSPLPLYRSLAASEKIPWRRVSLFLTDERYVAADHPDSNRRAVQENLLIAHARAVKNFYAFPLDSPRKEAAKAYESLLRAELKTKGFDLLILGLGPDGHIASLFPHAAALTEKENWTATTETDCFAVKERLTLTWPPLLASEKILLLVSGAEKEAALQELLTGEKTATEFPAKTLLQHPDLLILQRNHA